MRINSSPHHMSLIEGRWNGLGTLERVKMILTYPDHFLDMGLVTPEELQKAMRSSESEMEYILCREERPFFQNLDLKKGIRTQHFYKKLKAALNAVFLKNRVRTS